MHQTCILRVQHWRACCQAGIAATNPCFTQFHLLLNGKSSQLNQWSAPVNNCFSLFFSKSNQEKIILCIDFCETLVCKFQTCTNAWFVYYVPVQLVRRRVLFKSRSIGVTTFWIQILRPSGLRPTSTSFPHHITARRKSAENPPVAQWAEVTFLNPRHCC